MPRTPWFVASATPTFAFPFRIIQLYQSLLRQGETRLLFSEAAQSLAGSGNDT
jgi:hypothetical protein